MGSFADLMALSDLLQPTEDDEREYEQPKVTPSTMTMEKLPKDAIKRPIGQIIQKDPKAIWDVDEIASDNEDDEDGDTRKRPRHEILFKQDVMTEDVFLGLGEKDPSVAHCDAMVVKISFPDHRLQDITLEVKPQKLIAQSHKMKLSIFLPNRVHDKAGKAKWECKQETLVVTLPLVKDEW